MLLNDILESTEDFYEDITDDPGKDQRLAKLDYARLLEMFAQITREWTEEGKLEREQSFGRVLSEIKQLYPDAEKRSDITILVPGCGLARLPVEISQLGFQCKANEQNMLMLFAANFILNKCERVNNYRFYPKIHEFKNQISMASITSPVAFPDIDPNTVKKDAIEILNGHFLECCTVSEMSGSIDCVVTSFFLETALNVMDYVDTIFECLKTGGYWINFGSFSYVYEKFSTTQPCIQLSWIELKAVIEDKGFKIVKEQVHDGVVYGGVQSSMAQPKLSAVLFVCQK